MNKDLEEEKVLELQSQQNQCQIKDDEDLLRDNDPFNETYDQK